MLGHFKDMRTNKLGHQIVTTPLHAAGQRVALILGSYYRSVKEATKTNNTSSPEQLRTKNAAAYRENRQPRLSQTPLNKCNAPKCTVTQANLHNASSKQAIFLHNPTNRLHVPCMCVRVCLRWREPRERQKWLAKRQTKHKKVCQIRT